MNYRHSYHAGNHADVFKHAILLRLVQLLQRKDAPLCYLDSHAGTALYDLQGDGDEVDNVIDEHPEVVARLRERLAQWARPWVAEAYRRLSADGPELDAKTRERLRELGYLE